eukprot:11031961-Alexandrium_andersonii.AAC.1
MCPTVSLSLPSVCRVPTNHRTHRNAASLPAGANVASTSCTAAFVEPRRWPSLSLGEDTWP